MVFSYQNPIFTFCYSFCQSVRLWLQEVIDQLEFTNKVDGPLTWKAFHQLAGRGQSESCKAQPIPQFLVAAGPDSPKENVLISPFGVRDWVGLFPSPLSPLNASVSPTSPPRSCSVQPVTVCPQGNDPEAICDCCSTGNS